MSEKCPCGSCKYLDKIFGDCCHPKGKGAKDFTPSLKNCGNKNWAWYESEKKRGDT